jgi:hypothetical protein
MAASRDNGGAALGALAQRAGQDGGGTLSTLMQAAADPTSRQRLDSIYSEAGRLPTEFTDGSLAALNPALAQVASDFALGGRLNDDEVRNVSNAVRAGQAARGNFLGDAALVQEVVRQADAGDQKRQQRLGNLLSVQNQVFGQNDTLRDDSQAARLARIDALGGLQGQDFGQRQQQLGLIAGLEGQRFSQSGNALDRQSALEGQRFGQNANALDRQAALAGQSFSQTGTALDRQAALAGQAFGQSANALDRQAALAGQAFGQSGNALDRQAALQGQMFGQTGAAIDRQTGIEGQRFGQQAQGINTLAGLQQQLFGNAAALRGEQNANLGLMANLTGQDQNHRQGVYQTQLGGLGAEAGLNNQQVQENRTTRAENFGRDQQRLANASAMVLGQPITNQFGSLQGAQQGAVGFTGVNYQPTGQLNQNAGQNAANFAQGNFGTQANIWGQQAGIAAQGNPWMALAGQGLGAAAGAGGAALGAMLI